MTGLAYGGPIAKFVQHYYFGGGNPVTLSQMGVADEFEQAPSVRQAITIFLENLRQNHRNYVLTPYEIGTFQAQGSEPTNVTTDPGLFVLGNGELTFSASCLAMACNLDISYRDVFQDPLDLHERFEIPEKWAEAGGTPYEITHQWTEAFQL